MPDRQDAQVVSKPPMLEVTFTRFAEIAKRLATAVTNPSGFVFDQSVKELLEVAIELSGAAVASCRQVRFLQEAELLGDAVWAPGFTPVGVVPKIKHHEDCRPNAVRVDAWTRTETMNKLVRGRKKNDESQYYSGTYFEFANDDEHKYQGEIGHFHWLKSEAIVPLRLIGGKPTAMIVLGHPDPRGLNLGGLAILDQCGGLIDAFYGLATFAGDRIEKARLLEQVASVLPLIASAETEVAFARAVCTLLTCNFGFRFDRAFFFRMTGHTFPAECLMAVGGIGDDWPATREKITALSQSHSLDEFIRSVLDHPLPQEDDGTGPDPLYAAACRSGNPVIYSEKDSLALDKLLKHGIGTAGGSVLRLSHDDPWIKTSHHARQQMFFNRNNEFFVFALQPIKPESGSFPLGFVVADLPYSPWKHQSGPGFPDLEMVSITLKLLAGLWSFRNDSRSYFHILGALPLLRHSGGRVLETVDWIRDQLDKTPLPAQLEEDFDKLRELAVDVARAKDIVDSLRRSGSQVQQLTLGKALLEFAERMKTRHSGLLADVTVSCPNGWTARIHQDALDEILMCLVDNAAVHGSKHSANVRPWWMRLLWPRAQHVSTPTTAAVRVNVTVTDHDVPESGGVLGKRLLLTVANDGEPIPPKLTPFLFANRVSTHQNGFGSGLSSARQLAKAFGGDVVFLSASPVKFGVVLESANSSTGEIR